MPEDESLNSAVLIPVNEYMRIRWVNDYTMGSTLFFILSLCAFFFISKKRLKKILTIEKTIYESKGAGFSHDTQEFFVPPSRVTTVQDLKAESKVLSEESREKFIREKSENMFASITSIRAISSLEKGSPKVEKSEVETSIDTISNNIEVEVPKVKVVETDGIKWASFSVDAEFIFDDGLDEKKKN